MFALVLPNLALLSLGFFSMALLKFIGHLICVRIQLRHVPGPRISSLIWGEEWSLYHNMPGSLQADWHNRYGKLVRFSGAFGHQIISITDPRAISFILNEGIYSFPKPIGVRAWFKATLGEGILWVEGKDDHERQRRTLAPALSPQAVRNLTYIFHETSTKLASQWGKIIDESTEDSTEIEATHWAGRFALDTIGRAAFSYDFGCLEGGPHSLAETLDGLTNTENNLSSFYIRALFWVFPSILRIGVKGEMIKKTKLELGEVASKMWQGAKESGDAEERTMLAMINRDAPQRMDEEQVVSQMRTTISAGYETVTAVVSWLLYELACNPDIQEQLREETVTAINSTFDKLNSKYPLLDAVLNETLRLHPAILENHHEAGETINIPLSEPIPGTNDLHLIVPKGTLITIPVNVLQTDPSIWGPDAHLFRPERWIERKQEGLRPYGREIFAFSKGPRSCIGKAFAIAEIKVLTITILRHFSFTCPYKIEPFQSFVIRPRVKGQGPSSLPLIVRRI
ncbi:cytochrome P450 [Pluteus cervinus]|uniref:Cytochrome P450 n=1 Tax=Pluteus cervinus TaxID=181527 RepID=A0ACD3BF37_9AGAR|nr:cytochrome P450 [Pluteus cervinus]